MCIMDIAINGEMAVALLVIVVLIKLSQNDNIQVKKK